MDCSFYDLVHANLDVNIIEYAMIENTKLGESPSTQQYLHTLSTSKLNNTRTGGNSFKSSARMSQANEMICKTNDENKSNVI